ncbi:MAG: HupE/UreJ family protein [Burkholderiaceae bacterium]|jgi:urease accessory protein|nr:HupE/UreJ family protein [Burkholderiaceae bacterium]
MKAQFLRRIAALALLGGMACAAQAHTGHSAGSLMQGLTHPFGFDHLLAMVAVGVWSVSVLPAHKVWQGPALFMLVLAVSAALGMMGLTLPYLEHMVSLSVILFGAMLLLARSAPVNKGRSGFVRRLSAMPATVGLGLIAAAASLHGLAHGAETPASGFAGYAVGFLATTALLHVSGVGVGLSIRRWLAQRSHLALGSLGAALGIAGIWLFGQLAA